MAQKFTETTSLAVVILVALGIGFLMVYNRSALERAEKLPGQLPRSATAPTLNVETITSPSNSK